MGLTTLLMVMNPRSLLECVTTIGALKGVDRAWLRGYTEHELEVVVTDLVAETDYDRYTIICDDSVVTQHALDLTLDLHDAGHPVTTAYCNLDLGENQGVVNLTRSPLIGDRPTVDSYDLYTLATVQGWHEPVVPTWFSGMSFTTMSRELWLRYPFRTFGGEPGFGSDFALCKRLQDDKIPIVAARDALTVHVKETWNQGDKNPRARVVTGHGSVEWDT